MGHRDRRTTHAAMRQLLAEGVSLRVHVWNASELCVPHQLCSRLLVFLIVKYSSSASSSSSSAGDGDAPRPTTALPGFTILAVCPTGHFSSGETGEQCSLKSMSLFCDTAHCQLQPFTFSHLRDAMLLRATRLGCVVGRAAGRSAPASARWYAISAKNVKVSRRLLTNEDWLGG